MIRLAPLALFVLLALLLAYALLNQTKPKDTGAMVDTGAFPAVSLASFDGKKQFTPAQLNGHITLINFFASWCTPCIAEMPELIALKKQFPDLRIEGIVWNDEEAKLKDMLKKAGNPFDAIWLDKNGDTAIALGIRGIPESYIVDAKGHIRYHLAGPMLAGMREGEITQLLKTLEAEAADAQ